jgi:hypothetical protein
MAASQTWTQAAVPASIEMPATVRPVRKVAQAPPAPVQLRTLHASPHPEPSLTVCRLCGCAAVSAMYLHLFTNGKRIDESLAERPMRLVVSPLQPPVAFRPGLAFRVRSGPFGMTCFPVIPSSEMDRMKRYKYSRSCTQEIAGYLYVVVPRTSSLALHSELSSLVPVQPYRQAQGKWALKRSCSRF